MLHIKETIIVEGKFDKERIKRICDAPIISTNGFGIFKSKKLLNTIVSLAKTTGIIILTDSDRAGFVIRNYIKQCVGNDGVVKHAYIPSVAGKEKRKDKPGKEGLLGVEGISDDVLAKILSEMSVDKYETVDMNSKLTKSILYSDGLSGKPDSLLKRRQVLESLNLPVRMSPNAMIDFINKADLYDKYKEGRKYVIY